MSVVSSRQFSLMRSRRGLEQAFAKGDWESVRQWDSELGQELSHAFDTKGDDTRALITELEKILKAYAGMVSTLPDSSSDICSS